MKDFFHTKSFKVLLVSIFVLLGLLLYTSSVGSSLTANLLGFLSAPMQKISTGVVANAAALGEFAAGAGKGSQSMIAITLGTGVGGGAVLNGKLYTGFNYAGMEVGHFVIEHDGRLCTCGRKGCFEAYCSATALIKRTREVMEDHPNSKLWELAGTLEAVNGRTPFDAAALGDAAAGQVIDEYVDYLGCGVASLVNIFQPEVFCIGGGPSAQGETLMAPVRYILNREDYARNSVHRTRLVRAALGNDAGIIGAALLPLFR